MDLFEIENDQVDIETLNYSLKTSQFSRYIGTKLISLEKCDD